MAWRGIECGRRGFAKGHILLATVRDHRTSYPSTLHSLGLGTKYHEKAGERPVSRIYNKIRSDLSITIKISICKDKIIIVRLATIRNKLYQNVIEWQSIHTIFVTTIPDYHIARLRFPRNHLVRL